MLNILTFPQWQDYMISTTVANEEVNCPSCGGEGTLVEECHECGHQKETTCSTCKGEGGIVFGKIKTRNDKRLCFPFREYIRVLLQDVEDLVNWTGDDMWSIMQKNGLAVCQTIREQRYALVDLSTGHHVNIHFAICKFLARQECAVLAH